MRSVFIYFKEVSRTDIAQFLDDHYTNQGNEHWIFRDSLYIGFYDDAETEASPEELDILRSQLGRSDVLAVVADISGRINGLEEANSFCEQLLSEFNGFAMDDYSDHLWTLDEIRSRHRHQGHMFFEFRRSYE